MSSRFLFSLIVSAALLSIPCVGSAQTTAPRPFATGVVKTIKPVIDISDTFTYPMVLPGSAAKQYKLAYRPESETLHAQTQYVILFKDIWQLEFSFIGLRQMDALIPTTSGIARQNVWYLVYRVRNVGTNVTYRKITDPKYGYVDHEIQKDTDAIKSGLLENRFFPKFVLEGWVQDRSTKQYSQVRYLDSVLPTVVDQIQEEEDPNRELLDSVEISRKKLEVEKGENGGGVWGVAVFAGVDPKIDYVSIKVSGLTNAYRVEKTADGEIKLRRKILQLNFWRPGDTRNEPQDRVDFGIPLVDDPVEQVNITRFYQLPGPVFRVYEFDKKNDRYRYLAEADAEIELKDFTSLAVPKLNGGSLSDPLKQALANVGVNAGDPRLRVTVNNSVWQFDLDVDGTVKTYEIRFEPLFWEKERKGIRFIKSLDHLWIYR